MDVCTRNEYMVSHDYFIKAAIRRNMTLLKALRLEIEDVYQELAMAMLRAVDSFNPDKSGSIDKFVSAKLQYAVLDIKRKHKPCGMTGLSGGRVTFASIERYYDDGGTLDLSAPDVFGEVEISDALATLTEDEREALRQSMDGLYHRTRSRRKMLASAREKIKSFYMHGECYAVCY